MKKYLITGFSGFVSGHFLDYLTKREPDAIVMGIDINDPSWFDTSGHSRNFSFKKLDLLDSDSVREILDDFRPDFILHLASYSSVAFSWQQPVKAIVNNLNIFLNLVDQVRLLGIKTRILSVGSSEEYGMVRPEDLPLREDLVLNPMSPYAVARVSQEQLSKVYVDGFGLDIIMTRSFNHIGPGQTERFAIPSFVKKLIELKKSGGKKLLVGDIDIIRDFVDVRDVVEAYYLLLENGKSANVYNICSGQGNSLRSIIEMLSAMIEINPEIDKDLSLFRPSENPVVIGSNKKIHDEIGWSHRYSLEQSLRDIVAYWEEKLR